MKLDLTKADLAFQDVIDGHLSIRNSASGEDDLDDEAAAFLRGDAAPALALQAKHDAKIRAAAAATPEEKVAIMINAGNSIPEIGKAVGWSRRKTLNYVSGKKPRVHFDNQAAVRLRNAGAKLKDVAAQVGCSIQRASEICGAETRGDIPREKILSLRAAGWSFRKIEAECKVSTVTVQRVLREAAAACA